MGIDTLKAHENQDRERYKLVNPIEYAELLNSSSEPVSLEEIGSSEVQYVIDEMMYIAAGKDKEGGAQMVGLAAPQIGILKQIAILDIAATGQREKQEMIVLINPRIVEQSTDALVDGREGCWSCGDYCANVPRLEWVIVEAFDRGGAPVRMRLDGFTARIAQHEIDHLGGVRCIDRVPLSEPERLHLVRKDDADEFNLYRANWRDWQQTFPREEWERFRGGLTT